MLHSLQATHAIQGCMQLLRIGRIIAVTKSAKFAPVLTRSGRGRGQCRPSMEAALEHSSCFLSEINASKSRSTLIAIVLNYHLPPQTLNVLQAGMSSCHVVALQIKLHDVAT